MNTTESVEQNQDHERHREMVFTVYDRLTDTAGKPMSKNWEDWAALFRKHDVRGDPSASNDPEALKASKDGPAVVLGKLADGLGRKNAHVTSIEALALDFDGVESDEVVDAISPLCDSNFEFVLYSTHSHGAACKQSACYYRVIVPLKDPIEPDRLREAWDRLNNFTGAISDRGMREPARIPCSKGRKAIVGPQDWKDQALLYRRRQPSCNHRRQLLESFDMSPAQRRRFCLCRPARVAVNSVTTSSHWFKI